MQGGSKFQERTIELLQERNLQKGNHLYPVIKLRIYGKMLSIFPRRPPRGMELEGKWRLCVVARPGLSVRFAPLFDFPARGRGESARMQAPQEPEIV
jgi:hypothetical protein